jgi:phosphoenolpyruvate-protein kinase (PTS system EI component)
LSVSPPAIATTKEAVRAVHSREAATAAAGFLTADSASAVREQLNPS